MAGSIVQTGVYVILNKVNHKLYVGSTAKSFKGRWTSHREMLGRGGHGNSHLQAAWDKYGPQAFMFIILERCSPEQCIKREQFYIDRFDAAGKGYNLDPTAGSRLGSKVSEEGRARMSTTMKAVWATPEFRQKMEPTLKRLHTDPVTRSKKAEAAKQEWADPETRKRILETRKRNHVPLSPEAREKHGEASRKDWADPEKRRQRMEALKRGCATPEARRKRGEAAKRVWNDPEVRQRRVNSLKATLATPEARRKKSEASRKMHAQRRAARKQETINMILALRQTKRNKS